MMIKPDGVQRNLIGEIISKIEKLNLRLVKLEFKIASQ
jgi:nucleoside diphosphate kinase